MDDDVLVDVFGSLSISAPKRKGRHEDKENRAELANRSARALQQKAGLLAEKKEELARKKEELQRRKQEQAVAKSSERQPSPNRARSHRAENERSEERPTAHGVKERKGEGVATPRRNPNTELSRRPRPSVIVRKERERELLDSLFGDDEGDSSPSEEEEVARPRRAQVSVAPARKATTVTMTSGTRKNEVPLGKSESEKRHDEAKRKADSGKRRNFRISMFVIREAEEEDKGSRREGEDSGDDEYDLDDSFINDDVEEYDDSDDDTDEDDEDEQEVVECGDSDIEVVSEVCEIDANTKATRKEKEKEKETIVIVLSSDDEDEESTQYYNDAVEVAQTKRKEIERMPHLKKTKEVEVLKTPTRTQATPTTPRTTHQATPRGARQPTTRAAQPSTPAQRRERETKEEGIIGSDRRLDAIIERNVFTPREFKQRREALTRDLFREFNKRVFADQLPSDLPISWNSRLLTTAGLCKCVRKLGVRSASVELATKVCTNFQRLFETLIHELCHAGQWLVLEDSTMGHGATFRYWGKLATKAYPGLEVGTCHAYDTVTECRYRYQCTNPRCKTVVGRHSPSLDPSTYRCKSCGSSVEMLLAALARS